MTNMIMRSRTVLFGMGFALFSYTLTPNAVWAHNATYAGLILPCLFIAAYLYDHDDYRRIGWLPGGWCSGALGAYGLLMLVLHIAAMAPRG